MNFGYEGGGASQFGGGGFMPSPENAAGGSAQKKGAGGSGTQTLRRVTIKQLHDSINDPARTIDGKEVANVALVGKVITVRAEPFQFNVMIDDGSGHVMCKYPLSSTDDNVIAEEQKRCADLHEGLYVRVFGNFNTNGRETYINTYAIRPVKDYNEVTYHIAQTIFQHLHLTKGADADAAAAAAAAGGNYGAVPFAGGPPAAAFGGDGGMNPVQTEILKIFNTPDEGTTSVQGISAQDVVTRSGGRYTVDQVKATIHALVEDGHLYTTNNDTHFKSCNMA